VWSNERTTALQMLAEALDTSTIEGVSTNKILLANILKHPEFVHANLHTRFLDQEKAVLLPASDAGAVTPSAKIDTNVPALALPNEPGPAHRSLRPAAPRLAASPE